MCDVFVKYSADAGIRNMVLFDENDKRHAVSDQGHARDPAPPEGHGVPHEHHQGGLSWVVLFSPVRIRLLGYLFLSLDHSYRLGSEYER